MFRPRDPETASVRADYAKRVDFCEVFERDLKALYLLAFLLTTNHEDAERCLGATIEEAYSETGVFKAWVRSWVRRCLIRKAIHVVLSRSARGAGLRSLWCEESTEPRLRSTVNAVTGLEALERFVFVTSILEGYSTRECSLLLNCSTESVVRLRLRASCRLAVSDPLFTENLAGSAARPESG